VPQEDYDYESDYSQQSRYHHRLSGIIGEMSMVSQYHNSRAGALFEPKQ